MPEEAIEREAVRGGPPPWEEVADDFRIAFPGANQDALRARWEQQRQLALARFRHRDWEVPAYHTALEAVPIMSTYRRWNIDRQYGNAVRRLNEGKPEDGDFDAIAQYERYQASQQNPTVGEAVGSLGRNVVSMAGEAVLGSRAIGLAAEVPYAGAALRAIGLGAETPALLARVSPYGGIGSAAANVGLRGGAMAARTAVQTASMPGMWAPGWVQENIDHNRDPLDWRGLPPAFAHGMIQTAILGSIGHQAQGMAPGRGIGSTLSRLGMAGPIGMIEEQAAHSLGAMAGITTGYGPLENLYRANTGRNLPWGARANQTEAEDPSISQAWGQAASSWAAFTAFGALHEPAARREAFRREQVRDFTRLANELHQEQTPPAEAARLLAEEARRRVEERFPEAEQQRAQGPNPGIDELSAQRTSQREASFPQAPESPRIAPEPRPPQDTGTPVQVAPDAPVKPVEPVAATPETVQPSTVGPIKSDLEQIGARVVEVPVPEPVKAAEQRTLPERKQEAFDKMREIEKLLAEQEMAIERGEMQRHEAENLGPRVEELIDSLDWHSPRDRAFAKEYLSTPKTLEEVGGGLSRERVRQVIDPIMDDLGVPVSMYEAAKKYAKEQARKANKLGEPQEKKTGKFRDSTMDFEARSEKLTERLIDMMDQRILEKLPADLIKRTTDAFEAITKEMEDGRLSSKRAKRWGKEIDKLSQEVASHVGDDAPAPRTSSPQPEAVPAANQVTIGGGQESGTDTRRTTALANAKMEFERKTRNASPLAEAARLENRKVWDEATDVLVRDPQAAEKLLAELTAKARATTVQENALLLHHKITLKNEYSKVVSDYVRGFREKAPDKLMLELEGREAELQAKLDVLDKVTKAVGTEWGRSGQFRRQLAAMDYSLAGMMFSARKAKGESLTIKEAAKIEELQKQIEALNAKVAELEAGGSKEQKQSAEFQLSEKTKEFHKQIGRFEYENQSTLKKGWHWLTEGFRLYNAYQLGFDLPPTFRQGMPFTLSHPIESVMQLVHSSKALGKEGDFRIGQEIKSSPSYEKAMKAGLKLTESTGANLEAREEWNRSNLINTEIALPEWVPVIGGVDLNLLGRNQRWHTAYMNLIRMRWFELARQTLTDGGTDAQLRVIADGINTLTGRGAMPSEKAERAVAFMSDILTSPRFTWSRFQTAAGRPMWYGDAQTRMFFAKEYAKGAIGLGLVLGAATLAKRLGADVDVETDPASSDFGKIRTGNTRFDPYAGVQQSIVLAYRLATGQSSVNGQTVPAYGAGSRYGHRVQDVATRYVRSRFSPAVGVGVDTLYRENYMGSPFGPLHAGRRREGMIELGRRLGVPITVSDVAEAFEDLGFPKGMAASIWAIFGGGLQSQNRRSRR